MTSRPLLVSVGVGIQRIIAWEAPRTGRRFVAARVVPSFPCPIVASGLIPFFSFLSFFSEE